MPEAARAADDEDNMSWDFDRLLRIGVARDGEPCLIELGRALDGKGAASVGYFWSTGRIGAGVGPGGVRIRRRFGVMGKGERGNDLTLEASELRALEHACHDWARRRDEWAAFYFSTSGYPAGFGGASYYQPPGKDSSAIKLGSEGIGGRQGKGLVGSDDVVPLPDAVAVGAGASVVAELWRRGERHGPRQGVLQGVRYALCDDAVVFDARRHGGEVRRREGDAVHLEPGEESFVTALVRVV